jgi:hypothetical protein
MGTVQTFLVAWTTKQALIISQAGWAASAAVGTRPRTGERAHHGHGAVDRTLLRGDRAGLNGMKTDGI